jgi:hypothetical protein
LGKFTAGKFAVEVTGYGNGRRAGSAAGLGIFAGSALSCCAFNVAEICFRV